MKLPNKFEFYVRGIPKQIYIAELIGGKFHVFAIEEENKTDRSEGIYSIRMIEENISCNAWIMCGIVEDQSDSDLLDDPEVESLI